MDCILGLGISGQQAILLAEQRGIHVLAAADGDPPQSLSVPFVSTEELIQRQLAGVSRIVTSPGIPPHHPLLALATRCRIPIISEVAWALPMLKASKIGITGTNGKTTTVAMLSHILSYTGLKAVSAGNIGLPVSQLALGPCPDVAVVELSSFQLAFGAGMGLDAAAILNLAPDHLDWHPSLEHYYASKWQVVHSLRPRGGLVLGPGVADIAKKQGLVAPKDTTALRPSSIEVAAPDSLWQSNAQTALSLAAWLTGRHPDSMAPALETFTPPEHRCHEAARICGYRIIEDSKATNVSATCAALKTYGGRRCILMLGGKPKGESFRPLEAYAPVIDRVLAFGEAGAQIASELSGSLVVDVFRSLREALPAVAANYLGQRDIIFAPGCASFDEFGSYGERGRFFLAGLAIP